jgi:hypothetical protein
MYSHWITNRLVLPSGTMQTTWDRQYMATYWQLWKERNRRIFQNTEKPTKEIHELIQREVERWQVT